MHGVDEHITISKSVATQDGLDANFLKEKGIEHIERLGRKLWTNYNISDSGIAFLEVLIYGINDLENRLRQPIQNILASKKDNLDSVKEQFHTAKNILTTAPVTPADYRKLLIDINGIKNAWLVKKEITIHTECNPEKPVYSFEEIKSEHWNTSSFNLKGLYTILIDFDELQINEEDDAPLNKIAVMKEAIELFHKNRNLCEELAEIKEIPTFCIKVCGRIQIEDEADEELIHAQIRFLIEDYLSPNVGTYTLNEMLDRGMATEDIFDGPILTHGFIDNDELKKSELKKEVRLSDIIRIIMGVEGVKHIEEIQLLTCTDDEDEETCCGATHDTNSDDWIICIPAGHKACYCEESNLQYKKNFLPVGVNAKRSAALLHTLRLEEYRRTQRSYDDLPFPRGEYADFSTYSTLQNNLPDTYGVGENGLPPFSTPQRQADAIQLKAYLLNIEQILAIYFSQLGGMANIFSTQFDSSDSSNYVPNLVQDLHELEKLVGDETNYKNALSKELEKIDDYEFRRNEFLNHLIARFGETYTNYAGIMNNIFGDEYWGAAIDAKNAYYKNLDTLSYNRYRAFDYTAAYWDTDNIHGLQNKLGHYLGIKNKMRRALFPPAATDEDTEGMFAIEHSVILPTKTTNFLLSDASSFEITRNGTTGKYNWTISLDGVWYEGLGDFETDHEASANFYESIKSLCNGVVLSAETDGRVRLLWVNKKYETEREEKNIIARSQNDYTPAYAEGRIASFKNYYEADAFDFCCLGFSFIDTNSAHLDFNKCALPCVDELCQSCTPLDFFSYRMTFVLPGWTQRFRNMSFRKFVEYKIYEMLPAHILPRVCWVGYPEKSENEDVKNDMEELQRAWKAFLRWKSADVHPMPIYNMYANELLCKMNHLNNLYPQGYLHDCEDDTKEDRKKIILNQSTLGSLKNNEQ